MQDKQSIFDELVSHPSPELPPIIHAIESLPLVVDGILLIISALLAWSLYGVWKNRKGNFALKKWINWLEKNCDFISLMISWGLLLILSSSSFFHEPVLRYLLNNPLVVATLFGFPILIKRVSFMQEQTEAMRQQAEIMRGQSERMGEQSRSIKEQAEVLREQKDVTQQQMLIGQKQARFVQYNAASELLRSPHLSARMTGIESLWRFAQTHPQEEYHNVMDVFSQFIKYPVPYEWEKGTKKEDQKEGKRKDISAILEHMIKERMAGAEPYQIDLSHVRLEGAVLWGANLEGAVLWGANLEGSRLDSANLKGAVLLGAHLERAQLQDANLEGARLTGAHLERAFLYRANLKGALLVGANLEGAESLDANLEGAHLRNANLEGSRLASTNLKEVDFLNAKLRGALLVGANLEGSHFFMVHLTLAIINNANFTDATYLTQEQINECVFITDYSDSNQPPTLPNGIEHEYQRMSISEWQDKSGRKF